jgi:hypothetical protein
MFTKLHGFISVKLTIFSERQRRETFSRLVSAALHVFHSDLRVNLLKPAGYVMQQFNLLKLIGYVMHQQV